MYLCARKSDMDENFGGLMATDPLIGNCSMCSQEVYYDEITMQFAVFTGDPTLVCNVCIGIYLKTLDKPPTTL